MKDEKFTQWPWRSVGNNVINEGYFTICKLGCLGIDDQEKFTKEEWFVHGDFDSITEK